MSEKSDLSAYASLCGQSARELSDEELKRLESDVQVVSDYHQNKLEKEAKKNWDLFYKRNGTRFFKDRHWTLREFKELLTTDKQTSSNLSKDDVIERQQTLLEIGCGVGNFFFPLIEEKTSFFVYACDFSSKAIELCKSNPLYDESVCRAFVADVTQYESFVNGLKIAAQSDETHLISIASLIFVLSAVHPDKMKQALSNVYQVCTSRTKDLRLLLMSVDMVM